MITVVLHEPQEIPNIAHVVRAMMNFGFSELRLVRPREYDAWRIEGIAHRSAELLAGVRLFDDLPSALADCVHVVAFSARGRTARRQIQRPREAAAEVLALAGEGPVALLFGREDTGLDNGALDLAHRQVTIPTSPEYTSLNLGHAVVLFLYELALARGAEAQPTKRPRRDAPPPPVAVLEQMLADADTALDHIEFFKHRNRELVMRTVRGLAHRVPLDLREAKLLRSMAIEIVKYAERVRERGATGPDTGA